MVQYSNFDRVMEVRGHFKNGASSKSQTSKVNQLKKMKKNILLFIFCFSIVQLFAQNDTKNIIGTHGAFGFSSYGPVGLKGAPSYSSKHYYTVGFDYSKQLSKRWDLCSGLEYTYNDMTMTPAPMGEERPSWNAYLTLVTIPVQIKYHFGKVIYFNSGILLNVLASERSEAYGYSTEGWYPLDRENKHSVGLLLGFGLGIGFEHEFDSGITLFLNPYARFNGIGKAASFQSEPLEHYKYLQGGVSLGIGYKF